MVATCVCARNRKLQAAEFLAAESCKLLSSTSKAWGCICGICTYLNQQKQQQQCNTTACQAPGVPQLFVFTACVLLQHYHRSTSPQIEPSTEPSTFCELLFTAAALPPPRPLLS